jgi:hypothetical protein
MSTTPEATKLLAPAILRDKFLIALDEQDYTALDDVRMYLIDCGNILPSTTCAVLGLKSGSTYGDGAEAVRQVIALAREPVLPT